MCSRVQPAPRAASLSPDVLRGRLRELASDERAAQVDFILHLAEFDRRKGYLDAGYGSLWTYCLRELRLREGPAARRIAAMRVLRQHPALEAPLRDGRLCMTTVTLIAPLIAEFGVDDLVARAANLTKADVEQLVATLRPGAAPRDGVRQLASRYGPPLSIRATRLETRLTDADGDASAWPQNRSGGGASTFTDRPGANALSADRPGSIPSPFADPATVSSLLATRCGGPAPLARGPSATDALIGDGSRQELAEGLLRPYASAGAEQSDRRTAEQSDRRTAEQSDRRTAELRPVTAQQWSLRVTMDARMKEDLETLKSLLSHTAGGDLSEIVREALRCAVERHGKRRGAIAPARVRSVGPAAGDGRSRTEDSPPANASRTGGSNAPSRNASAPGPSVSNTNAPSTGAPRTGAPSTNAPSTNAPSTGAPSTNASAAGPLAAGTGSASAEALTEASRDASARARVIPAAVRRAVWARDQGCCSWQSRDGRRCGSRWKLELDHITPVAHGGESTEENLRLICRAHNVRHAEQIFGRRHMAQFTANRRERDEAPPPTQVRPRGGAG